MTKNLKRLIVECLAPPYSMPSWPLLARGGSDLTGALGLTCEQIEQAIWEIAQPPTLPDDLRQCAQ